MKMSVYSCDRASQQVPVSSLSTLQSIIPHHRFIALIIAHSRACALVMSAQYIVNNKS